MKSARATAGTPGTANLVLDVAERLAQTRGFNGFSYADISAEVGITKASLHYHFRTKSDLGQRLIERYAETFRAALEEIRAREAAAPARLALYVDLYTRVLQGNRMCLCGMLAAEFTTLPAAMQGAIRGFFDLSEAWLAEVVEAGRTAAELEFDGSADDIARLLLGALEGAMLVARSYDDVARFETTARRLIAELLPAARPASS